MINISKAENIGVKWKASPQEPFSFYWAFNNLRFSGEGSKLGPRRSMLFLSLRNPRRGQRHLCGSKRPTSMYKDGFVNVCSFARAVLALGNAWWTCFFFWDGEGFWRDLLLFMLMMNTRSFKIVVQVEPKLACFTPRLLFMMQAHQPTASPSLQAWSFFHLFPRNVFFFFRSQSMLLKLRLLLLSQRVWQRCDRDGGGWVERLSKSHIPQCRTAGRYRWRTCRPAANQKAQSTRNGFIGSVGGFKKRFSPFAAGFVVRPL